MLYPAEKEYESDVEVIYGDVVMNAYVRIVRMPAAAKALIQAVLYPESRNDDPVLLDERCYHGPSVGNLTDEKLFELCDADPMFEGLRRRVIAPVPRPTSWTPVLRL